MATAPSNTNAEQIVLGAILLSEQNYWTVCDVLEPDAFFDADHRAIYQAMANLANADRAITQSAIQTRVQELPSKTPITPILSALQHQAKKLDEGNGLHLAEVADDIAMLFSRRQITKLAQDLLKKAEKSTTKPNVILDEFMADASDLVRSSDRTVEKSIKQVARETLEQVSEAAQGKAFGLTTGLYTLDSIIGEFVPGDFVLWGGAPGASKTTIAMQIAMHVAQSGHAVDFFQLEMDLRAQMLRVFSAETGISSRAMIKGVEDGQFESLSDAAAKMSNLPLDMVAKRRMTIGEAEARMRSSKRRKGTRLVVVDHLGRLHGDRGYKQKFDKDFENAERLMETGKSLGIAVICLCHLTKSSRQKEIPQPEMEDFYGGGIEQHADIMLCNFNKHEWLEHHKPPIIKGDAGQKWLSNLQESEGKIEIHKLKDRRGPGRQRVDLRWEAARTLFSDIITESAQTDMLIKQDAKGVGDEEWIFE